MRLRTAVRDIGDEVKKALAVCKDGRALGLRGVSTENHIEMMANYTLAFRHLEDARMRLGKVIQYLEGGTSIFDK